MLVILEAHCFLDAVAIWRCMASCAWWLTNHLLLGQFIVEGLVRLAFLVHLLSSSGP